MQSWSADWLSISNSHRYLLYYAQNLVNCWLQVELFKLFGYSDSAIFKATDTGVVLQFSRILSHICYFEPLSLNFFHYLLQGISISIILWLKSTVKLSADLHHSFFLFIFVATLFHYVLWPRAGIRPTVSVPTNAARVHIHASVSQSVFQLCNLKKIAHLEAQL